MLTTMVRLSRISTTCDMAALAAVAEKMSTAHTNVFFIVLFGEKRAVESRSARVEGTRIYHKKRRRTSPALDSI